MDILVLLLLLRVRMAIPRCTDESIEIRPRMKIDDSLKVGFKVERHAVPRGRIFL
jgi:hypothetical protein